jgi:hypothetical protein
MKSTLHKQSRSAPGNLREQAKAGPAGTGDELEAELKNAGQT